MGNKKWLSRRTLHSYKQVVLFLRLLPLRGEGWDEGGHQNLIFSSVYHHPYVVMV